ncbi:MAG: FtsX-like permease family protein [Phycisphaerales bacterium]|jgi:putative ABC transport system permease protein|nr:FtsX-like permease family protein [Phycisphaerales bacterium]
MNLFELVFKQMRQRALSTWLTLLSVLLGVGLAIAIMILRREGAALLGQTEYGYDVLIGAKGSELQLVVNTVYHIEKSPGNIPYSIYETLSTNPQTRAYVQAAVPVGVGDSYQGYRIVGTLPALFGVDDEGHPLQADQIIDYRPGYHYEVTQGHVFHPRKFQAILGSDIPKLTGLTLNGTFKATHGLPLPNQVPDIHSQQWTVVGILKPTHTAADRAIYIPLTSFYAISEHGEGLKAQAAVKKGINPAAIPSNTITEADHGHDHDHDHDHDASFTTNPDGTIDLHIPKEDWSISAIMVKARNPAMAQQLMYVFNNRPEAQAVNPASVMRTFFENFLKGPSMVLLLISLLVTIVAAVAILVSIYNSVSARLREIAILRALGATRGRVLALICVEAGMIGLVGGVLGFILGHGLGALASVYFNSFIGEGLNWMAVGPEEVLYLVVVVVIALLAGLVPALKAYRTPVATNLVTV